MQGQSQSWRLRLYSTSPWLLGVACLILLLILAFFAVTNYEREKKLITGSLEQRGLTIIRFVSSTVVDSMRFSKRDGTPYEGGRASMQRALDLAVDQPGVDAISIVDKRGNILHSSGDASVIGSDKSDKIDLLLENLNDSWNRMPREFVIQIDKQTKSAFLATRLKLRGKHLNRRPKPGGHGPENRFRRDPQLQPFRSDLEKFKSLGPVYILQLDFEEFAAPLRRQFIQIVLELLAIFFVGIGGTLSFLTLRGLKGSEKKLSKMKGFNEALVASLPLGVIATGEDGTIQIVNEPGEKMIGLCLSELLNKHPKEGLPKDLASFFDAGSVLSQNLPTSKAQDLNLKSRSIEVTVFEIDSTEKNSRGKVLLLRDKTELKKLEEQLHRSERLALVGKMAAGVAHELRNPLSSIKGLALLLESKIKGSQEDEKVAETFVAEVERLNRSIGELLDYARPQQLDMRLWLLSDVLEETLSLIEPELKEQRVKITKQFAKDLPESIFDREKIRQVVLNILLNALQAMEEVDRPSELTLSTNYDKDHIRLAIGDNGSGIDSATLENIYDPYFTTKSAGTGLGLALSLKTVEEHDGSLQVDSCYGEWTEFELLLPIR